MSARARLGPLGLPSALLGSTTGKVPQQLPPVSVPRSRPQFHVALYGPLPDKELLAMHPVPAETSLSWRTQVPGGDAGGQIGFDELDVREADGQVSRRRAYMPDTMESRPFGHVEIRAGSDVVSEGRIINDEMPGGKVRAIEYEGYGFGAMDDDFVEWHSTDLTTSGRLAVRAIVDAAPLLVVATGEDFVDPGAYHSAAEFDQSTPGEIFDALATEGGGENTPWIFTVYDRIVRFVPYAPPEETEYTIPIDDTVDISRDYEPMRTHLAMAYRTDDQGERGYIELQNPRTATDLGFTRRKLLSGSTPTASAAQQFLQTQRTLHADPDIGATVRRDYDRGLELTGGGERAVWLVQAGEWVTIHGLGKLLIEKTDFDASSGRLSLDLGKPTRSRLTKILMRAEESARALRAKHDPVTKTQWNF